MIFEKAGRENTRETVSLALQAARDRKIGTIVVASYSGYTARFFMGEKDMNVVCVGTVSGFRKPGENDMTEASRRELEEAGIRVVTAAHALSGAERGVSRKFGGVYPVEMIAHTLRLFGQGTKVCVEIAAMALDAGLIGYDKPVVAVGGTGGGADTCMVLTPAYSSSIFETKIHETICKPY